MNATALDIGGRALLDSAQADPYATVFPLGHLSTWLNFFVVTVASSQLGGIFTFVGLPLITGYMFVGALVGPQILGLIRATDLLPLTLVTQCALAFICFSAGAELYLPELRSLFKRINYQTAITSLVTFLTCTGAIVAAAPLLPFLNALRYHHCRISVAAVAASIMVARSPASAIALVKELRAKGPFTSAVLGMTVLGDVYVLLLFSLTTSIARTTCDNEVFSVFTILVTLGVMVASVVLGAIVGRFLMFLMLFRSYVQRYLILPLGLGIFVFSNWLSIYTSRKFKHFAITLESLLICIVAGYVCTNNSGHRHRFMLVLGRIGPYVFLPFFTLTGATLNLRVLATSIGFASVVAIVRALCILIGSASGGYMAGVRPLRCRENMLMWTCLLTQAGVSLGLASEMGVLFPAFGAEFQTALIAVILINQIAGPVLFRVGMRAVGEAGKGGAAGDEWDQDATVPIALILGKTPGAMALAARLLSDHWAVSLVCGSDAEAELAAAEMSAYGEEARGKLRSEKGAGVGAVLLRLRRRGKAGGKGEEGAAGDVENGEGGSEGAPPEEAAPELDEHGHPVRKLEENLRTLVLPWNFSGATAAVPPPPPPAASGDASAAVEAGTAHLLADAPGAAAEAAPSRDGPLEAQLGWVLAQVPDLKRLAAVVLAGASDADNLVLARAFAARVAAAPKKSPLRSARALALLRAPAWAPSFEALEVMPVHVELHASYLAAKLLTAPRSKPVTVLSATATLGELAKAVAAIAGGAAMRSFAERYADDDGAAAAAAAAASAAAADAGKAGGGAEARAPEAPAAGNLLQAVQQAARLVPRSFAELKESVTSVLAGEEVSDFGPARQEYMENLAGLSENASIAGNVLGVVSERSNAHALQEMAVINAAAAKYDGDGSVG